MPTFTPPTRPLAAVLPDTRGPAAVLFRRYTWESGLSVVKVDGVYQTVENPSSLLLESASEVYLGGHVHTVDQATADALTAAGYGAFVS